MKLLSLTVRGFGALPPGTYDFGERTLVLEGNAAGKSTLTAAVRAALYGLNDDRRRQRAVTDHEAHLPWQGGPYGLSLRLETREGVFTIERDFTRGGGCGQLAVWDASGQDAAARFLAGRAGDRVGLLLAGVGPAEFDRAALAADRAWGTWSGDGSPGLVDLLGRAVSSEEGGGTAAAALAACDEALRRYDAITLKGPGLVDNEIRNLEEQLRQIGGRRAEIAARHEGSLSALTRLAGLQEALVRLDGELAMSRRRRLQIRGESLRRSMAARSADEAELDAARRRAEELSLLGGFPLGRERELDAQAEQCSRCDGEARFRRRRLVEKIEPRLRQLETELTGLGPPGPGVTADLEAGLGALLAREARLAELQTEREGLRERIVGEGEDPALHETIRDGLDGLGETERQFLRDQERLGFEHQELLAKLERDEREARDGMASWERAAKRRGRGRNAAVGVAVASGAAAVLALLPFGEGAVSRLLPPEAAAALGSGLALAALAFAWLLHRRVDALRRRRVLQGEERLAVVEGEREAAGLRLAARRERLSELGPALLGPARAALLAATPDDLLALYRRHDAFRNRHDGWFRVAERVVEESAEAARLRARLAPLLAREAEVAASAPPTAALQAELARRRRAAELEHEIARLRETEAAVHQEEIQLLEQAADASRRAAAILAVVPPACRDEEGIFGAEPGGQGGDAGVLSEIERLAPAFRRQPRPVCHWFTARAAEAQEARRLVGETLPTLERRLAAAPAAEELARDLAAVERELASVAAEAPLTVVAASAVDGGAAASLPGTAAAGIPSAEQLQAATEALRRRREDLVAEMGQRSREVVEVERERRELLPELMRAEQEAGGALERARDFRAAVTMAREAIARLAGELYGQWVEALDADAARLVGRLCPEIAAISFTPELDYSVTLADGRRLDSARVERQLSSGLRDQIVLSIRLALARFLARPGEPLPILLDDPFVRYDDERFRRGMAVLAEELPDHQIILLTCQAGRIDRLRETDGVETARWTRLEIARRA